MRPFTPINLILLHPLQTERVAYLSERLSALINPEPRDNSCCNSINPSEPIQRNQLARDTKKRFSQGTISGFLLLQGFLGSLPSHAERAEQLRLVDAVPSGFEQTLRLQFAHFKVDKYTASKNQKSVTNTRTTTPCHIAIIDDVVTSMAAANHLAERLQQASFSRISLWALARSLPPGTNRSANTIDS